MTSVPISQCGACQRLRGPLSEGAPEGLDGPWCEAFPAGIPEAVYDNTLDHREPIEGDHGLRWLARPGASYPVVYTHGVTAITAAGAPDPNRAGAMVALMPRADWAAGAAVDDGLAADELHVTLAHLGDDASAIPEATRGDILRAMADLASRMPPLEARAFAVSLFNPLGEQPCVVLGLGGAELALLRANAMADLDALDESGALGVAEQHQPWVPHVTLAYTDDHFMPADLVDRTSAPVPLDRLRVAFGDQVTDFALGECPLGQHKMPDGSCMPDELMLDQEGGGGVIGDDGAGGVGDFHLAGRHNQASHAHRARGGAAGAAKRTKAMIRDYVGGGGAKGKSLRQVAQRHGVSAGTVHRELVRSGVQLRPRGGVSRSGLEGARAFGAGDQDWDIVLGADDDDFDPTDELLDIFNPRVARPSVGPGMGDTPWHAQVMIEGEWSGDARQVVPGALTWEGTLPFTLAWQPAEAPQHHGAVAVGRVDGVARVGPNIWAWGVFDTEGVNGAEALRLVEGGYVTGVSVTADDVEDADIEIAGSPDDALASPRSIMHHGRLRSLTLLNVAAFPECRIMLGPPPVTIMGVAALTASAVAPHDTPISEATDWDGAANEARLPSPMPVATGRAAYAWIDDSMIEGDEMPKAAGRFPHHEVGEDGAPGSANLVACSAGIAALNGARGGTTVDDRQAVYDHLAAHLRDGDREPPPLIASAMVAAGGHTITIPDLPPAAWFDEPSPEDMPPFGALHVGDNGRVVGLLAPDGVTHRAFRPRGMAVTPPRGVDASEFMNKPVLASLADGSTTRLKAGNITMSCGHVDANDPRRADPRFALEHYDNSCSVVARVRVGESAAGTWVAGALLSSATAEQVERMMACALSGDWQDGRLNAALLVPVEGFPVRVTASARVRAGAVVASMTPVRLCPSPSAEIERLAQRIGRDAGARMAALKARRDGAGGGGDS